MAGYTRNDTLNNIADGNVISAADLDGEFDAIDAAFDEATGHVHDGTANNGAPITKIGPAQDLVVSTGAVTPKTDNAVDLGTSSFEFKDLYIDGTANIDSLVADTADINAGTIDGVTLGTNSAVTQAQIDNININGNAIITTDTNGNLALTPNGTGEVDISKVDIDSGTIDGTTIGGASAAAGTFTNLTASGTVNFTGATVSNGGTFTIIDINGGSIDGVTIGTNSAVTDLRVDNLQLNGNTISSTDTNGNIAITPNGTGEVDISKVDIDSGAIDGTTIGGSTPAVGSFTQANVDNLRLDGNALTSTDTNGNIDLTPNGTGEVNISKVDIDSGEIDGTTIGGASAAAGTFTNLTATGTVTIPDNAISGDKVEGGTINATTITTLASTTGNITNVNATTIDTTNIEVTNIKAKDGTAAGSIADSTGVVTLASSVLTTTDINGGTIDGAVIGGASAAAGSFTTLGASSTATLNTLSSSGATLTGGTINGIAIGGSTAAAGSFTTLNTSGQVVFNDAGADVDFRVEGDTNANLLFVDASADAVGIGTSSPASRLEIIGVNPKLTINANDIFNGRKATLSLISGASADPFSTCQIMYGASNSTTAGTLTFVKGDGTESARITSGGYFKATSTGSYINSTGAFHELRTDNSGLFITTTNASQTSDNIVSRSVRGANSGYRFFSGESSDGGDMEFNLRGDGNAFADGTWQNNGADYAEFFESANGQALTLGATVVLDGNKVREATDQDPASSIIGVVRPKEPSKASMMIGNTAWNKWANKYLSDDFDRYIMEDHDVVEWEETTTDEEGNTSTKQHSYESQNIPAGVTVPANATRKTHDDKGNKFQHYKLNPAWNPDSEYVNRENRPEWNIIGLLGQVKILKGQPVGDRWIKMRDVSETVEEWMIR